MTDNKHLASLLGGLWIDTGGLPDRSTFLLSAAVFRGLPHEGGAYPRGGSQNIIDSMIPVCFPSSSFLSFFFFSFISPLFFSSFSFLPFLSQVIEERGGRVLCRAMVEEILVDEKTLKATGVRVCGREIKAPIVVSSCGHPTTFQKLVAKYVQTSPLPLPHLPLTFSFLFFFFYFYFYFFFLRSITQKAGIKREIPVEASPGFLMCNVGIKGNYFSDLS